LQLHEGKFDSFEVKKHFYTFLTSRDSCHNYQKSLSIDLTVENVKEAPFVDEMHCK